MAEKLLSVHIEKAGGTSLEDFYKNLYGPERVLIYNPKTDTVTRSSSIKVPRSHPLVSEANSRLGKYKAYLLVQKVYSTMTHQWQNKGQIPLDKLPDDFAILHGHFAANKFDRHLNSPLKMVVLREPLSRMWSQYGHWKRVEGNVDWRVTVPYDPSLTFEQYALLPQLRNYQSQALSGEPLESFCVVGTTDNIGLFTQGVVNLSVTVGLVGPNQIQHLGRLKRLNESPRRTDKEDTNPRFRIKFREFHCDDYKLYEKAEAR